MLMIIDALASLDMIILSQTSKGALPIDAEGNLSSVDLDHAHVVYDTAAGEVTDKVMAALSSLACTEERLASLDRATHCLDATE